jgi:hypothetical protein
MIPLLEDSPMLRSAWRIQLMRFGLAAIVAGGVFTSTTSSCAAPPWAKLLPFQRQPTPVRTVSAQRPADIDYSLTEQQGPWLIMCTSFVGEEAEAQANELVRELRSKHRLQAFVFRQHFDFTQPQDGLGLNKYGGAKKMKPLHAVEYEEVAVMVGNFDSVNDPLMETTLLTIKGLNPSCLTKRDATGNLQPVVKSNQSVGARMSAYYRNVFLKNGDKRAKLGTLSRAFVTRNPLLPDELFVAKGLDPFVVEMNRDLPHSLLRCPKKYTVKVATFRGVDTMKPKEFEEKISKNGSNSKIDDAALKARNLCAAFRKQGVEAYEFHDVSESIVTIGSFDSVGEEREDGKIEINRAVLQVMEQYKAEQKQIVGLGGVGVVPKRLANIDLDPQPIPVEVPRQSLAANYNSRPLR